MSCIGMIVNGWKPHEHWFVGMSTKASQGAIVSTLAPYQHPDDESQWGCHRFKKDGGYRGIFDHGNGVGGLWTTSQQFGPLPDRMEESPSARLQIHR